MALRYQPLRPGGAVGAAARQQLALAAAVCRGGKALSARRLCSNLAPRSSRHPPCCSLRPPLPPGGLRLQLRSQPALRPSAVCVAARQRPPPDPPSHRLLLPLPPCTAVVPNGVATGLDIGLSNYSLVYITLSFYVMCKSTTPLFLLVFAIAWGIEKPSWCEAGLGWAGRQRRFWGLLPLETLPLEGAVCVSGQRATRPVPRQRTEGTRAVAASRVGSGQRLQAAALHSRHSTVHMHSAGAWLRWCLSFLLACCCWCMGRPSFIW